MYKAGPKFEGPFRVIEKMKCHNLEAVPQDSDLSFDEIDSKGKEASVLWDGRDETGQSSDGYPPSQKYYLRPWNKYKYLLWHH